MECHCFSSIQIPHTTVLYSNYLTDFSKVSDLFAHAPSIESVERVSGEVKADLRMRQKVAEILRQQNRGFGSDASLEAALDQFASGATAIVSGQQVGLFSGPSYTIYKILSALRIAEELRRAGKNAVAIFWLATEDHDLAEINHCVWPVKGGSERLELAIENGPKKRVGEIRLGEAVTELVERAIKSLEGPSVPHISEALRSAYAPNETYASAFGKLLARIFAGTGLILLDALSPELHALSMPLYRAALEQHKDIGGDLLARSNALEARGLHAQVKVTEQTTLLFIDSEGERQPLRSRNGDFLLGRQTLSLEQATELLANSPGLFSPNVLLRPVVQDFLLGTAAYVGGPAEIAYFAQASVVYKRLLGRMPVMMPRASFTVIEPHAAGLLRKYGLELADFFEGRAAVRKKMEAALLPPGLAQRFEDSQNALRQNLQELREPVIKLDATLGGALETAENKILYQFVHLQEKVSRALAFRTEVLDRHERELVGLLYPDGQLQERSLCFLPFLAAHGLEVLDEVKRRITPGEVQHHVLYL
jgi:bacillithiol biosynthesis cysteine-adding enzyme BshC